MRLSTKLSTLLQDPVENKDLLQFLMKNLSPLDHGEFIEYKGCKIGYENRGDDYVLDIIEPDALSETSVEIFTPSRSKNLFSSLRNQNVAMGHNNRVQEFTAYSGSYNPQRTESFVGAPILGITSAPTIVVKPQEESIPQPSHTPMIEDIKVELVKHQHNI